MPTNKQAQKRTPNLKAKAVKPEDAYEIYVGYLDGIGETSWYVLKHYQAPDNEAKNPYARVYTLAVSPATGPRGEYGDMYLHELTTYALQTTRNPRNPVWVRYDDR